MDVYSFALSRSSSLCGGLSGGALRFFVVVKTQGIRRAWHPSQLVSENPTRHLAFLVLHASQAAVVRNRGVPLVVMSIELEVGPAAVVGRGSSKLQGSDKLRHCRWRNSPTYGQLLACRMLAQVIQIAELSSGRARRDSTRPQHLEPAVGRTASAS